MNPARVLLALLIVSLSPGLGAQECAQGPFTTDPREIAASFGGPPGTATLSPPQATAQSFVEPPEITRIRSGLVYTWLGMSINDGVGMWQAYDADRHLFLRVSGVVKGAWGLTAASERDARLLPGQARRRAGRLTYRITSVPATLQQARRFACLANALLSTPPRSHRLPAHRLTPAPAAGPAMATDEENPASPEAMPEVVITGESLSVPDVPELPSDTAANVLALLKDGGQLRISFGDELLWQWFSLVQDEVIEKAHGTWQPPHVISVAVDGADNVYLGLDPGTTRGQRVDVVRITPAGDAADMSARVPENPYVPRSLAVDRSGTVLLPAGRGALLYRLPPGIAAPSAAPETELHLQDIGLPATRIHGIAAGPGGDLYTSDGSALIKVAAGGTGTALAGREPVLEYGGLSLASISRLAPMAVAPNGDVFIADTDNSIIRKVTPDGVVTTLAGVAGRVGTADGLGAEARFNEPEGIAVGRQGTLYVADTQNHLIRCLSPSGRVTTLAGRPQVAGHADGKGRHASFDHPTSIAVDSRGTVYVSSYLDTAPRNVVRKVSPDGSVRSWDVRPFIPAIDVDSLL